jgi:hypothetical protein
VVLDVMVIHANVMIVVHVNVNVNRVLVRIYSNIILINISYFSLF